MQPSTLVLSAVLEIHKQIVDDDGFCGYLDDQDGTAQLLNEVWDLYYAQFNRPDTVEELVNLWFDQVLATVNGEAA